MPKFLFIAILLGMGMNASSQLLSISDIQGEAAASPYNNQTISTNGAVTGVYKEGFFIRDNADEWCGIYVYDPGRDPIPRLGDTVSFTGLVEEYYGWTEIKDVSDYSVVSSGNPIPEPVVITAEEVGEGWESCLLTIENVICTNDNLSFGEWEVEDQSGTLVIDDLGVPYSPEEGQEYTITGNLSFSYDFFKLEPRDLNDIQILAPVYFTKQPFAISVEKTAIEISWSTNSESSTVLYWGYTDVLEMGQLDVPGETTEHSILIDNLAPASLIYVRAYAESAEGEAESKLTTFITASESTGEIHVAFNLTYTDPTFEDSPDLFTHSLADTIIKYIEIAEHTLDIAFYDFTDHAEAAGGYNSGIAEAMLQAAADGIQVRFITDADVAAAAPGGEGTDIPRIDIDQAGIMHHKFIIVDHESVNNSWVVTGSTNPNYNNLVLDFNNLVSIQDQSLAMGYLIEFNELWGGEGVEPNPELSKSGAEKEDNSPHQYNIHGTGIELYFSPSDHTTSKISEVIKGAQSTVDFAMMAFTENALGDAIVTASNNGAEIQGVIDYVEYTGSEFDYLTDAGLDILEYNNHDASEWPDGATVHHKFAVIDAAEATATVITGSHNWTASAESKNDENTLIIHDQTIAGLYKQESDRIRDFLLNPPGTQIIENDIFNEEVKVYPNPASDVVYLSSGMETEILQVNIIDGSGRMVSSYTNKDTHTVEIRIDDFEPGIYILNIKLEDDQKVFRKIVVK